MPAMLRATLRLLAPLSLTLTLAACVEKDDDTTGDTDETGTTDEPDPTSSTDPTSDTDTDNDMLPAECTECSEGAPCSMPICPLVKWTDEGVGPEFEEAVTCALEALRDSKPGRVDYLSNTMGGQFATSGEILLLGDGLARLANGGVADLCVTIVDEIVVAPLHPPQHFTDCLAETDTEIRFDCVASATMAATVTCQEREQDCSGF